MGDDRHPAPGGGASRQALLALVAGAWAGLTLPPLGFPPLLWPALAVLWALAGDPPRSRSLPGSAASSASSSGPLVTASSVPFPSPDSRQGTGVSGHCPGLLWGLAAVLVSHRWLLWLHPLDWVGVPGPLSLPVCLLLWGACGLAGGLLVEVWLRLVRWAEPTRFSTALGAACLWGLAEVLLARSPLFWIGLGGGALPGDPALAGLAALGGAGLVAALQLLVGWCLWRLVRSQGGRRGWLVLAVLLVLGSHLLGLAALAPVTAELEAQALEPGDGHSPGPVAAAAGPIRASPAHLPSAGQPVSQPTGPGRLERLLVLQPAIPTRHKFEVVQQRLLLDQLAHAQRRSADLPEHERPQSLLLPEGALALGQPLPEIPAVEVLSGGFRQEGTTLHSSLLRFEPGQRDPVGWVDKHRLVPLGEWVPLADLWRWSGLSAVGGLEPGGPDRLLSRPAGPIGVAICYEIADGIALARASREGATWLLASANLDPYPAQLQQQFLALARLRAIETGRWLVSAANTGPSVLVDASGRIRAALPTGQGTSGVFTLQARRALTPYDRWGEMPLLIGLLVAIALALGTRLGGGSGPGEIRRRKPPDRRR